MVENLKRLDVRTKDSKAQTEKTTWEISQEKKVIA